MEKVIEKCIKTFCITVAYCLIWMSLEFLLYGAIENRTVDNIMMILFVPVIYKSIDGSKEK